MRARGLVPASGPPGVVRALWAQVRGADSEALSAALDRLAVEIARPTLRRALVEVRYHLATLTPASAAAHLAFAERFGSRISTWLPLCIPGAGFDPELRALATPPECARCLFYEARRCQGLGGEARPWAHLDDGEESTEALARFGPLGSIERGLVTSVGRDAFAARRPPAYWLPTREIVEQIAAAARQVGGPVWDIGGGNGFLASLVAEALGRAVTVVDLESRYPALPGVIRRVGDVRAVVVDTPPEERPATVITSWPPTGDGFRDVVLALRPRVWVIATDRDGFGGRRATHCGVIAEAGALRWFRFPVDDFAPVRGLLRRRRWWTETFHDVARRTGGLGGQVEVRAVDPLPGLATSGLAPYPWERDA